MASAVDNLTERRVRIAVVAETEQDRAALSAAFANHARHRVVSSVGMDKAMDVLGRKSVDAIVGFVDGPGEWARFHAVATRFPEVLSIVFVSEPDQFDARADGSVLNAVIRVRKSDITSRAADAVDDLTVPDLPLARADAEEQERLELLSAREREVLTLTARGLAIKEIARELHRGYGTIATHRMNIMEKLDIHDRVALARFAIRNGLIEA